MPALLDESPARCYHSSALSDQDVSIQLTQYAHKSIAVGKGVKQTIQVISLSHSRSEQTL
jgi:hypothetical protein